MNNVRTVVRGTYEWRGVNGSKEIFYFDRWAIEGKE